MRPVRLRLVRHASETRAGRRLHRWERSFTETELLYWRGRLRQTVDTLPIDADVRQCSCDRRGHALCSAKRHVALRWTVA